MENNIEVNNLSKKYDTFELKNINFTVPKRKYSRICRRKWSWKNDNNKINFEYNKLKWKYKI